MQVKFFRLRARLAAATAFVLALCTSGTVRSLVAADSERIDWNHARELLQKSRQGETLTPDERAFLERAQAARAKGEGSGDNRAALANLPAADRERAREIMQKQRGGEALTDDERAFVKRIRATMDRKSGTAAPTTTTTAPREKTGFVPLTEMTASQSYKGRDGGLYGGGKNEPPAGHAKAALVEAARIKPLDAEGKSSPAGKIVLLSVGMSNTTQEYSRFKEIADRDPDKSPNVVLVDGAQGGQAAAQWVTAPDNHVWQMVDARLKSSDVTGMQVQVVWLKQANIRPTEPFPAHAQELAADITKALRMLKQKFPNLRIAYLSSRIYAGYATSGLNPEPYAYESAFAVRDVIARQIQGDAGLNYDSANGAVTSPLLLWGPYLWADGLTPRSGDGLTWRRDDLREDGTHPSPSGRDKVANLLLTFLKTDRTAMPWFVAKRNER